MKKGTIVLFLFVFFSLMKTNTVFAYFESTNAKEDIVDYYKPEDMNCISTTFEDNHFEHNTTITIDFFVCFEKKIDEYWADFSSDGIILENKNELVQDNSFDLSFNSEKMGEFEIEVSVHNEDFDFYYQIYVFSIEKLDFVSDISISEAKRGYFFFLYENELADASQYNEIVFGYEKRMNIEEVLVKDPTVEEVEIKNSASGWIFIFGYIYFTDLSSPGTELPAKEVTINIYDEEPLGNRVLLGSPDTSATGFYFYAMPNDTSIFENGYDIIVEIKFQNDYFQIQDSFQVYEIEYGPYTNIPNETFLNVSHTFDNADDHGVAINLYEACVMAFDYLEEVDPEDLEEYYYLGVEYPYDGSSCWYLPGFPNIYMGSSGINEFIWDNLLHEFGHYVADMNDFSGFIPAAHSMEMNLFAEFGKTIGVPLAWSEGWASYFSISCQTEMNAENLGVINVGDTKQGIYDIETVNSNSYLMGECNEYVLAMLLYDIGDKNDDGVDLIDWGHNVLFIYLENLVADIQSVDPEEKLWAFHEFYDSLNLPSNEDNFGALLCYYWISAKQNAPIMVSYTPPSFIWDKQGGVNHYINNDFFLYIMDLDGQLVMDPISVGNVDNYTFSEVEWNMVLASGNDFIEWNVSASQTSIPLTGPYFSGGIMLELPTPIILQEDVNTRGNLWISGQYDWYQFTASASGVYSFYSSGTTDTYAEFFNNAVAGTSIFGMVAYDNDSGSELNFCSNISLNTGQTVFLRVRGNNWTATGRYTVSVWGPLF